jgi:predicted secreted protein
MRVELAQSTTTVEVAVGDHVDIALEARPGAGAIWRLEAAPGEVCVERRDLPPSGLAPGSPVLQLFSVVANAPGEHVIRFVYGRPWEATVRDRREVRLEASAR